MPRPDVYEERRGRVTTVRDHGCETYWINDKEHQHCDKCGELFLESRLDYRGRCPECREKGVRE